MAAKQRASVIIRMISSSGFNRFPPSWPPRFAGAVFVCSFQRWQFAEVGILVNHLDVQAGGFQPFN